MNDPKDIIVSIENIKEDNSLNLNPTEENNENIEETRYDNLLFHIYENLGKRFYKKTIKEIDLLIKNNFFKGYSRAWKIYILKIRAILKIVTKKIKKYLINHFEKMKIKHHINTIKKYLNQIPIELNNFFENFIDSNTKNDGEKIDNLLRCYYEYIYLYSFFHKKIGNIIESISYLSFILRLHKETQFIVRSEKTISHLEKCFLLYIQMLIINEDYLTAVEFLNLTMNICLKHLVYNTKDISDGIFMGDKNKLIHLINNKENLGLSKNKYENYIENNFGDKKIKNIIIIIVFIYFYRGICYENIGKMKNAIKCYYQCLWFLNHFFYDDFKNFSNLIKKILNKSLEFKEAIDYLDKKIIYYEHIQKLKEKNNERNDSDKEEKKRNVIYNNSSISKKFKGLITKLSKLKINEIDTVNKFEVKKNIKDLSSRKREGKDKNIFLSDIRLLETYLREDFRDIIDDMDKIKCFDMDYSKREKIQKLLRRIYFEQSQNELNKKRKNNLYLSGNFKNKKNDKTIFIKKGVNGMSHRNFKSTISFKRNEFIPKKKKLISSSTFKLTQLPNKKNISIKSPKSPTNIRAKSTISERRTFSLGKERNRRIFSPYPLKSDNKNQTINFSNKNEKNSTFMQRYKNMKLNSAKVINKIEEENKELNKFFNKKYIKKRNFIKKLEDRELKFQKNILKLKDTPKNSIEVYNKQMMKQSANQLFQRIMSLFITNPVNWKENLSQQEIKNIMLYDKLENIMIKSLDSRALIRFKNEDNKQKGKKYYSISQYDISLKNINNNNKNIINDINNKIEELKQKEIIENKIYQKLLIKNRKYLKNNNEKQSQNINPRKNYKSENVTPHSRFKKLSFN